MDDITKIEEEVIDERFLAQLAIDAIYNFVNNHNEQFKDDPEMQLDIGDRLSKSFIMWEFVRRFCFPDNKCGFSMINYDRFLYPDFAPCYETKRLDTFTFTKLKKRAKELLETEGEKLKTKEGGNDIIAHWQSIIDGKAPFGYEIYNPLTSLTRSSEDSKKS